MDPDQENNLPEISVILITPDNYETIRKTIQTIRLQENKNRIEVIIVGTTLAEMNPDEMELHFHTGRQFAAYRAETQRWNLGRRLFYSAAAPLIPLFRLWRILKDVQRLKKRWTFTLAILPPLCLGLTIDAIGQFCGHLFGRGNSSYQLVELEFHRNSQQKKIRRK